MDNSSVNSNGVNPNSAVTFCCNPTSANLQQYKRYGYYDHPMYNHVKDTILGKVFKQGIRDVNTLYSTYSSEMYDIGLELKWTDKQIQYGIERYGLSNLDYWVNRLKL